MRTVLTVVVPDYDTLQEVLPQALEAVARSGSTIEDTDVLGEGAFDIFFDHDDPAIVRARAEEALERGLVDGIAESLSDLRTPAMARRVGL